MPPHVPSPSRDDKPHSAISARPIRSVASSTQPQQMTPERRTSSVLDSSSLRYAAARRAEAQAARQLEHLAGALEAKEQEVQQLHQQLLMARKHLLTQQQAPRVQLELTERKALRPITFDAGTQCALCTVPTIQEEELLQRTREDLQKQRELLQQPVAPLGGL